MRVLSWGIPTLRPLAPACQPPNICRSRVHQFGVAPKFGAMRRHAVIPAVLLLLAVPTSAHAARVPDLTVVDAGVLSPVLVPGQKTKVSVTVKNRGRAASRRSVVRFF